MNTVGPRHESATKEIRLGDLYVDGRVQRKLIPSRVTHIAKRLAADTTAVGVITINVRPDGRLSIVDGQHRWAALLTFGDMDDWPVLCNIHYGLDMKGEAALARELNDTRVWSKYDKFKAGLWAQDPTCLAMNGVAKKCGLKVSPFAGDARISCVAAMERVFCDRNGQGAETLHKTLSTVTGAWGKIPSSVEGKIVEGVGRIFAKHNGRVDQPRLIRKLAKFPGGAPGVLALGKVARQLDGISLAAGVARVVEGVYNKGATHYRLDT